METELERTKKALDTALIALETCSRCMVSEALNAGVKAYIADINAILNPPPALEEVEVEAWTCKVCGTLRDTKEPITGNPCCWKDENYVQLLGSFQRPKPQPVVRSVSVEAQIGGGTGYVSGSCRLAEAHDLPALANFPECHGKRVTLTATWTEP